jgi:uncharacterized Tic20 family protein
MASTFLKSDDPTLPKEEMIWARRSHLTTLLTYPLALLPLPFSWIVPCVAIFPLTIWISRKKNSYSAIQSLEAIYLQAILSFGYIGFGSAFSQDRVLLVFSYILMTLIHATLLLIAAVKVSYGKNHKYPFSFIPRLFRSVPGRENWKGLRENFSKKEEFQEFKSAIENLDTLNQRINLQIEEINDANLRSTGRMVIESLESLRSGLLDNPGNYRIARQFLNYFPQTTAELLEKYNSVESKNKNLSSSVEQIDKRKENLNQLMEDIFKTSEDVRTKILASENLALDVEISSMRKNIEYGGY